MSSKLTSKPIITLNVFLALTVILSLGCDSLPVSDNEISNKSIQNLKSVVPDFLIEAENSPLFTTEISGLPVEIISYHIDTIQNFATFDLNVYYNSISPLKRVLNIDVNNPNKDSEYFKATLIDKWGHLLWEFEYDGDYENSGFSRLIERTSTDEMIIEQKLENDLFTENYSLNGSGIELLFPTGNVDRIAELRDDLYTARSLSGLSDKKYSIKDYEILDLIEGFNNFNDINNTLYNNVDGFLMAEFITNIGIAKWLGQENNLEMPGSEGDEPVLMNICDMAGVVVMAKCPIGGLSNPGCDIAVSIVIICLIYYAVT